MFRGDIGHFPLVLSRFEGELTDADIAPMRAFYTDMHGRGARFLHLVDARGAKRPNSLVRKQLAALTADMLADSKRLQAANAIVLDGALLVGVLTAIRWAVPAAAPERHFSSVTDAMAWLESVAAAEGITLTADARAAAARIGGQV